MRVQNEPSQNHLLGLLPEAELEALLPHLEPVWLDARQLVFDLDRPIEHVYFPEDGVVSIVGVMRDGSAVEVATVGNEGMVGLSVFLGADRVLGQAFAQVPGAAFRVKAQVFRRFAAGGMLHELLHHYTQALFTQVSQSAACNRLHLTEQRFGRWLLMSHDRVGRDDFQLTQDFLAQMLGVRRATVSEIAGRAQRDGIIKYSRGNMNILDRERLEEVACECYGIIRAEFDRLLGKPKSNPRLRARPRLPLVSKDGMSTARDGSPQEPEERFQHVRRTRSVAGRARITRRRTP